MGNQGKRLLWIAMCLMAIVWEKTTDAQERVFQSQHLFNDIFGECTDLGGCWGHPDVCIQLGYWPGPSDYWGQENGQTCCLPHGLEPPFYEEAACDEPEIWCACMFSWADCLIEGGNFWPWRTCGEEGFPCCGDHERMWWGPVACYGLIPEEEW